MENTNDNQWDLVVKPTSSWFNLKLSELMRYKDLLFMFVRRDVVTIYKQTILGPLWILIQPIFTTVMYVFVFGNVANLPTEGIPKPLFYLSGVILWGYFSEAFSKTSSTFSENAAIFGKVYFPRLIMPLSKIFSALIKFGIQFALFLGLLVYYLITEPENINAGFTMILLPLFLVLMAGLGLGFGLIFSSLTTKYRDLKFLIQFGVQLLMYATPIIYPLSMMEQGSATRFVLELNPISHIIEAFKYAFVGNGSLSAGGLVYSGIFTLVILLTGIVIFNRTEKTFMDTV
ncbi:MAG: ABC transporter permease [Flavobacteriales bacterium]|nr:ABC transporter permease [Flavobacteriales bacterium]